MHLNQVDRYFLFLKVEQQGVRKFFQEKCSLGKIAGNILAYETDPYGIDE